MKRSLISIMILLLLPLFTMAQEDSLFLDLRSHWKAGQGAIYNDCWGWTSPEGSEYAIIGSLDSIFFVDITDPEKPVLRDAEAGKFYGCTHRDFKTYKNYCYAVADEGPSSLQIFDLKYLPDSVHKVYDSDTLCTRAHNIYIESDRLYFASHKVFTLTKMEVNSLAIASLQDPELPVIIGRIKGATQTPPFNDTHDVNVKNDTAYCSNESKGIYIYDLRDATKPEIIGLISPPYPHDGYNHSSWLAPDNKSLVFADETHGKALKLYDISPVKNGNAGIPKFQNIFGINYQQGSIPHNPFIKDSLVFVAYYHEGVGVFDISDPGSIKLVSLYDTYPQNNHKVGDDKFKGYEGCWGVYPFFPSGSIVASDISNGLFIFKHEKYIEPVDPADPGFDPTAPGIVPACDFGSVSVFTNSFSTRFKVFFKENNASRYRIALIDMSGKVLFNTTQNSVKKGVYTYEPLGGMRNGIYIISIETPDGKLHNCKFLKQ